RMFGSADVGVPSPVESLMPVPAAIDARRPSPARAGGLLTGAIVMVAGYSGLPLTLAIDTGVQSLPVATLAASFILTSAGVLILLILRRTSRTSTSDKSTGFLSYHGRHSGGSATIRAPRPAKPADTVPPAAA
ncbi:MAG TPA: hypothetical protein VF714_08635, partial [Jatrophihabitans sp.]